jgi:hypothetical protein
VTVGVGARPLTALASRRFLAWAPNAPVRLLTLVELYTETGASEREVTDAARGVWLKDGRLDGPGPGLGSDDWAPFPSLGGDARVTSVLACPMARPPRGVRVFEGPAC